MTVTDGTERRHSVDVQASSTFDAAHLFVTHAKGNPALGLPPLDRETVFEIVIQGKVHSVRGDALQRWIEKRRHEWKGRGGCFSLSALISLTEAVHETQEVAREHYYLGGIHGICRYVAMTLRVFVSGNSAGKEVHHSLLLRRWQ